MCHEVVTQVLKVFKTFMRFFSAKICCKTVVRSSGDMSPPNFGEFTMRKFRDTRTIVVRMPYDSRATDLRIHANISRLSGEKLKSRRHSYECRETAHKCLATVVRMILKLKLHSWELLKTHSRMPRDFHTTVAILSRDILPKLD